MTDLLRTSIGDFALHEYSLPGAGRRLSFLHTGAVFTVEQERKYLAREEARLPYGVMLWPASIALAHELMARAEELRGKRVLELGAGTGMPGLVAASLGARVLQVDHSEVALHVCALNKERNQLRDVEVRAADWETFESDEKFDFIVGADVLYVTTMHERLRAICAQYLASGGRVLFSDPLREQSLPMMEAMDADGWRVSLTKWSVAVEDGSRSIAIYEAAR